MRWIKRNRSSTVNWRSHHTTIDFGKNNFPDCNELDGMMASALRKLYGRHTHFRKKVSVEEQRAQNNDQFLRGRQIASMIYDHFRSTGSCDGIQGLSDLFSVRLLNDDIHDFDLRWKQAVLSTNDPPADNILEGLYKSKLQDSSQLQTVLSLYNPETIRSGREPDYHRLRMCVKLHIDQRSCFKGSQGK